MSKKIEERLPNYVGKGRISDFPAIQSPWNKLVNYQEAAHYASRYCAVVSSALIQALRILVPDYEERAQYLCEEAYQRLYYTMENFSGDEAIKNHNIHPFCRGSFVGALVGDAGDEALLMCGRVNDFGTYRAEKELDVCDWDIVGSELCRATTQSLAGTSDAIANKLKKGTKLDYHMVEAKGCGDCHCRIVAESRDKFPMPPHKQWECFGPIATADQIKYTPEDELVTESMMFREECNYTFTNGTNWERSASEANMIPFSNAAFGYILPCISYLIKKGILEEKTVQHVIRCVLESAGKAAYGEAYSRKGLIDWLGAPADIHDGRLLGGQIEMFLQSMFVQYEIEAFNETEVIYSIDRKGLTVMGSQPRFIDALLAYWYGMSKTLISAQWSCWEEPDNTAPDKLRIRIAKKIDKFC